ncbi:hypothetical protein Rctr16k_25 [Virus Rctr16k]|nr:hypothetical protein Rctr16k_25 [Virus Rctr16k]
MSDSKQHDRLTSLARLNLPIMEKLIGEVELAKQKSRTALVAVLLDRGVCSVQLHVWEREELRAKAPASWRETIAALEDVPEPPAFHIVAVGHGVEPMVYTSHAGGALS